MWSTYLETRNIDTSKSISTIKAWHFCDNKKDANDCTRLVLQGKKKATSPSVWELELEGEKIPAIGDLNIITNWNGVAQCIIRTTAVEIVPFNEVSPTHASLEGEGDGSLEYWRKVHLKYYKRVLKNSKFKVTQNMPIVCEQFEVVFPKRKGCSS